MHDTYVTLVGNVVADPRHTVTASGTHVASVRLASTTRRFDSGLGAWRDGNTLFISVSCWRSLADNVAASVGKGDPLVVTGRLRMRSYTGKDGHKQVVPEIDASALGHDLSRGVTHFEKTTRFAAPESEPGGEPSPDGGDGAARTADSESDPDPSLLRRAPSIRCP